MPNDPPMDMIDLIMGGSPRFADNLTAVEAEAAGSLNGKILAGGGNRSWKHRSGTVLTF